MKFRNPREEIVTSTKKKKFNTLKRSSSAPELKRSKSEERPSLPMVRMADLPVELNIMTNRSMVSSPLTASIPFSPETGTPPILVSPSSLENPLISGSFESTSSKDKLKYPITPSQTDSPCNTPTNRRLSAPFDSPRGNTSGRLLKRLSGSTIKPRSRRTSTNTMLPIEIIKDPIEIAKRGFAPIRCDPKMTGALNVVNLSLWTNCGVKCSRIVGKQKEDQTKGFLSSFELTPYLSYALMEEKDIVPFLSHAKKLEFSNLSKEDVATLKVEQEKMFFETINGALAPIKYKNDDLLLVQKQTSDADGAYVVVLTKEGPMAFIIAGNHVLISMAPYVIAAGDIYFVNEPDGRQVVYLNASSGAYHHDKKREAYIGEDGVKINYLESAKKAIAATFGNNVVYIKSDYPIPKNLPSPKHSSLCFFATDHESTVTENPSNMKMEMT